MEVSQRVSHRLVTEVYGLFVQEVLGYPEVEFVSGNDYFNATETLQRMAADVIESPNRYSTS